MDMTEMLKQLGYTVLPAAYSYNEAIDLLEAEKPDLVLADINLGSGKTGIDLAQLVRDRYHIPLIFISSHSDKNTVALAAAAQPNGYLIKPFTEDDLFTSIEVALANFSGDKNNKPVNGIQVNESLFVKADTHFVKVNVADILWLESDHNYLYIVTEKDKHIVRSNFKDFLVNLPVALFMQVHKSYIVNLKKIDSFSHSEVVIGKHNIPLSRNFKDELFELMKRVQ